MAGLGAGEELDCPGVGDAVGMTGADAGRLSTTVMMVVIVTTGTGGFVTVAFVVVGGDGVVVVVAVDGDGVGVIVVVIVIVALTVVVVPADSPPVGPGIGVVGAPVPRTLLASSSSLQPIETPTMLVRGKAKHAWPRGHSSTWNFAATHRPI